MKTDALKIWLRHSVRLLSVIGAMVALVATIAWLSGMFEEKIEPGWTQATGTELTDQPTDVVHEVEKSYVEEAVGTLKASSRMIVSSKLLATIDEVTVAAGDEVEKGQLLVRLDDKEYQSRLAQANRALEAATANAEQAEKQFARMQTLIQQNAASRSDFDNASRDLQVTIADESRARQAMREAEVMLSYTTITSAKNGRIVDRTAEPGDIVQPGQPILTLYDASSLRLEAPVMEHLAVKLHAGDELQVRVDALDRTFAAVVDEIVPQADAPSRSFLVKASLPKSEDLYEGMFGRLLIPAGERRHLCLDSDAVVRIGQLEFVDVVLPDGNIERRLINSGQLGMPGRQEVLSGVDVGERVVLHSRSNED
ncbi:efflux RND transporter periplasmic adaptor subunit [Aporhodopirellula aestuarii]|uniref:Efflux RND transporter periplasmic adaptor subunit n=1 Tax=Aporhodopirellula aestuarii TaxID=2950107 RepID=A0ABT0UA05_9BACT|nr:efflux RND transporter periplasmic adaptor subunit [Aporhodopirellula aestuarii]MCM2373777.1 efflux RND transporter periplasmic adaptor subunit [Aporhodopirellula aestuarii]